VSTVYVMASQPLDAKNGKSLRYYPPARTGLRQRRPVPGPAKEPPWEAYGVHGAVIGDLLGKAERCLHPPATDIGGAARKLSFDPLGKTSTGAFLDELAAPRDASQARLIGEHQS
jgi:hypothetical protein